ncbi:MAG: hypothetical protein R2940_04400 [Syntrophotaleaceae bacterium]
MEPEVVMNLWIFTEQFGQSRLIYEVAVRPYMMTGSDEEKLKWLRELAISDFHFARRFALPSDRFYVELMKQDGRIMGVRSYAEMKDGPDILKGLALWLPDASHEENMDYFTHALDEIQTTLPTRRLGCDGPEAPRPSVNRKNLLNVLTHVFVDSEGNQVAQVDDARRNSPASPVANLWLFHDPKAKAIHALSGRAYMLHGSEPENVTVAKALAPYDFSMAKGFPVPDEFSATVNGKTRNGLVPLSSDGKYSRQIFNSVFESFECDIPQTIGIGGKIRNPTTVSADGIRAVSTLITERSSNVGEATPVRLCDGSKKWWAFWK